MYQISTLYKQTVHGAAAANEYTCTAEDLARAWFRCQKNAVLLDELLGRDEVFSVSLECDQVIIAIVQRNEHRKWVLTSFHDTGVIVEVLS